MNKLKAFFTLLRYGEEVLDPAKWKTHQIGINTIVPILSATLVIVGVDVDPQDVVNIAVGILSIANIVLTIITSKKVGV